MLKYIGVIVATLLSSGAFANVYEVQILDRVTGEIENYSTDVDLKVLSEYIENTADENIVITVMNFAGIMSGGEGGIDAVKKSGGEGGIDAVKKSGGEGGGD